MVLNNYFINSLFFDFYLELCVYLGVFFLLAFIFSIVIKVASHLVGTKRQFTVKEARTSYECGFEPFSDSRSSFDVRFYLVAILFIIFDLEIIYIVP